MHSKSILGVDLGGTNVRVGKVSNYQIVDIHSQGISGLETEEFVLKEVICSIDKVFDETVTGIGIGVPSLVDVTNGIVYDVQNIRSWKKVYLKAILEEKYQVPVYVNNDANCFVVGEKYFGNAKEYDSIVGLVMGTGLGSGFYFDNRLYLGSNCGAGEFGMIPYKESNYETYCSGQYFTNNSTNNGVELFDLAENGDEKALRVFKEFGYHLGNAISTIIYSVDPEIIILGGSISKSFKFFKPSIDAVLSKFPYPNSIKRLKIKVSTLPQIAVLGAAALYYESMGIEVPNNNYKLEDKVED